MGKFGDEIIQLYCKSDTILRVPLIVNFFNILLFYDHQENAYTLVVTFTEGPYLFFSSAVMVAPTLMGTHHGEVTLPGLLSSGPSLSETTYKLMLYTVKS